MVAITADLFNDALAAQERARTLCAVAQQLRAEIAEARRARHGEGAVYLHRVKIGELVRGALTLRTERPTGTHLVRSRRLRE